jgi:hypothetical protein
MQYPGDHHRLDDEHDEYDDAWDDWEPDEDYLIEAEIDLRRRTAELYVSDLYPFARGERREALDEAAFDALEPIAVEQDLWDADGDGCWLSAPAPTELKKALRQTWRKISRPAETARTRRPQRLAPMRRAGCRPRERRDGRRRSTRTASSGDDPGGGDPGGDAGDDPHEVARDVVAGWWR